jgi:tricorn protease
MRGGLVLALALSAPVGLAGQVDARMFRYPDVSATHIAFVYAGDVWIVPKTGGVAQRLSSPRGEEAFPRFSPDGKRIAYSANYDGNIDVYVAPTLGGEPVRVTYHPMPDRLVDWTPDGKLLFASSRESGRQRFNQFYLVPPEGGLPAKLPVPYGEFGAVSPNGRWFAYVPKGQDFRTWKRYRGGWNSEIWLFDFHDTTATRLAPSQANQSQPMWRGDTLIYFLADRGPEQRQNIWSYQLRTKQLRQLTHFTDYDITFPAIGPEDIVFQAGGRLYLLNLPSEKTSEVKVQVVTDEATLRPRTEAIAERIEWVNISPTGKRALFGARGEALTVPAEHGAVLNLTRTPGVAERYPAWSPDGKSVAYWSDRSGEYELSLRAADGSGEERTLTKLGAGFRYAPFWSPDSKKLAFVDQAMRLRLYDLPTDKLTEIDQSRIWMGHGTLEGLTLRWSPDSRWLAYAWPVTPSNSAIVLYDTQKGVRHPVTSGYFNDAQPVFDPEGKYLYYFSNRVFEPVYGDFDGSWTYPNSTQIVAVPLRRDVPSPIGPRNDAEGGDTTKKPLTAKPDSASPPQVAIDLEGFESRGVPLPPKAGNYGELFAAKGKVIYRRSPRAGSGDEKSPVLFWDLEAREEKTVLEDASGIRLSVDGTKLLGWLKQKYAIVDLKPQQSLDKTLHTGEMRMEVDPRAEWRQMFADAYRFERDFFYDPNMHGVDWKAMRDRYAKVLEGAVTRWDVNFVLGEFIAELNSSHTYRGGGELESAPTSGVGMLGVDWALDRGAYRIKQIVSGGPWDVDVRAPLAEPGLTVKEGDWVLAVNGIPLDPTRDPWAAFQGLTDSTLLLTVNDQPSFQGARQVTVRPVGDETELRFRAWVEARRLQVEQATGGRVGYVYVQSTGVDAQNELMRQFMAQWTKEGLVIDERFNSGGQIPDRFIELLHRPILSWWAVRNGADWQWPQVAQRGPEVMLINGWSGSGGDAFPFYFREAKVGPLIGTRTWGGLIGLSGNPSLVDGGAITVPTFRMYDVHDRWFAEGVGVEPDIPVDEDPGQLARGHDSQLDRAIAEVLRQLKEHPTEAPARPAYERRGPP